MAESVLLTGASGFIGRNTIPSLRARGFEVHAVARSQPVDADNEVRWHAADLLDSDAGARLIMDVRPTHLLHLAWYAEPGAYWTSPLNDDWVEASFALAAAFADAGGRRIVAAGSCAEYEWTGQECVEGSTPIRPATRYGLAKAALAERLSELTERTDTSLAWARLFFLFGRFERLERLVPQIARGVLAEESVPLTSGEQVRDFLYAEDAGDALAATLASKAEGPVNVASGAPVSVGELALAVADAAGDRARLEFGALDRSPDDPNAITADTTRLRELVGWTPPTPLPDAVEETVEWWRSTQPGVGT